MGLTRYEFDIRISDAPSALKLVDEACVDFPMQRSSAEGSLPAAFYYAASWSSIFTRRSNTLNPFDRLLWTPLSRHFVLDIELDHGQRQPDHTKSVRLTAWVKPNFRWGRKTIDRLLNNVTIHAGDLGYETIVDLIRTVDE